MGCVQARNILTTKSGDIGGKGFSTGDLWVEKWNNQDLSVWEYSSVSCNSGSPGRGETMRIVKYICETGGGKGGTIGIVGGEWVG